MPKSRTLVVVVGTAVSFVGLAATIIVLGVTRFIGPELAKLMLVALFGLYIGFGVLIAVYRLMNKLD